MLAPILAFGIPTVLAVVLFIWTKRIVDAPDAPIAVVDRRTLRLALRRIREATDSGDYFRAYCGIKATITWLNQEIATGPARHREEYEALRARLEIGPASVAV